MNINFILIFLFIIDQIVSFSLILLNFLSIVYFSIISVYIILLWTATSVYLLFEIFV